jgi:putative DNA primase/helicase
MPVIGFNIIPDIDLVLKARESVKHGGARDFGAALLFKELFQNHVIFDYSIGKSGTWFAFQPDLWWIVVEADTVRTAAMSKLSDVYLMALGEVLNEIAPYLALTQMSPTEKSAYDRLESERKRLEREIANMKAHDNARKLLMVAASMDSMHVTTTNTDGTPHFSPWDADGWLIGVRNGVVDLRSNAPTRFRPGRPEDFISKVANADWDDTISTSDLESCEFTAFVKSLFADNQDETYSYLMRLFGWSMTGIVAEKHWAIFYGQNGNNAKTTFLEVIGDVLGPYAGPADKSLILKKDGTTDLSAPKADLEGRRLIWISETARDAQLDVGSIKLLTGLDKIVARRPHEPRAHIFIPTHHLIVSTNYKPIADPNDNAFWGRTTLVNFALSFVENPQAAHERRVDKDVQNRLLSGERNIIFHLMVQGALDWQQRGSLDVPAHLQAITKEYQTEQDWLGRWLEECCERNEHYKLRANVGYANFRVWREDIEGRKLAESRETWGSELKKRFERDRDAGGKYYIGLALRDTMCSPVKDDLLLMTHAIEAAQRGDYTAANDLVDDMGNGAAQNAARVALKAIAGPIVTPAAASTVVICPGDETGLRPDVVDPAEMIQRLRARQNDTH